MRGIGIRIQVLADGLVPVWCAELTAVGTPCQCTALEVGFGYLGHLSTIACVAVGHCLLNAVVTITSEVAVVVFVAFYFADSEAVCYFCPVAQPA